MVDKFLDSPDFLTIGQLASNHGSQCSCFGIHSNLHPGLSSTNLQTSGVSFYLTPVNFVNNIHVTYFCCGQNQHHLPYSLSNAEQNVPELRNNIPHHHQDVDSSVRSSFYNNSSNCNSEHICEQGNGANLHRSQITEPNASDISAQEKSSESMETPTKKKMHRIVFTPSQLKELEEAFAEEKYPNLCLRKSLSLKTNLPLDPIRVWFQNRRAKWRKEKNCWGKSTMKAEYGLYGAVLRYSIPFPESIGKSETDGGDANGENNSSEDCCSQWLLDRKKRWMPSY